MKKTKKIGAQEYFFEQIITYNLLVNIFLKTGLRMAGRILRHDNYTMMVEHKTIDNIWHESLYFKAHVCAILPCEPLNMDDLYDSLEG